MTTDFNWLTTPRCIELNKNIFGLVKSDFFEILSDQNLDGLVVPILRDIFGLEERDKLSSLVVVHELPDLVGIHDLFIVGEVFPLIFDLVLKENWKQNLLTSLDMMRSQGAAVVNSIDQIQKVKSDCYSAYQGFWQA